jgi:hypothetical protein
MPSRKRSRAQARTDGVAVPAAPRAAAAPAPAKGARGTKQKGARGPVVAAPLDRADRQAVIAMLAGSVGLIALVLPFNPQLVVSLVGLLSFSIGAFRFDRRLWRLAPWRLVGMTVAAGAVAALRFVPVLLIMSAAGAFIANKRGRGLVSPLALGAGLALSPIHPLVGLVVAMIMSVPSLGINLLQARRGSALR